LFQNDYSISNPQDLVELLRAVSKSKAEEGEPSERDTEPQIRKVSVFRVNFWELCYLKICILLLAKFFFQKMVTMINAEEKL